MKFPIIPVVVFAGSLATVAAWQKSKDTELAVADSVAEPTNATPVRKRPGETLLSSVRAALRNGDMDQARRLLAEAAAKDPQGFIVVLSHLPHIEGWEDMIRTAGANLPWNDAETFQLLNGIISPLWRDAAWEAYAGARVDRVPDEEVFNVGIKANRYSWIAGIETLLKNGAEKRPAEMMDLLNRKGGTSLREAFCQMLMKTHPEMAEQLFRSIPDGSAGANYDRSYFLQAQVMALPTAKNIMSAVSAVGAGTTANTLLYASYSCASPEERKLLREEIANQSTVMRQSLLNGALSSSDKALPLEEFTELISLSPSGRHHREALEYWMKKQPELKTADRQWINQLPTEKLRARAAEILDGKGKQDDP